MAFCLVGVATAITEPGPYTVASSDAGYAVPTGYRIIVNEDIQINSINKEAGQASINTAYILDSGKNIVATASFVSNTATLGTPYTLTAGNTYYIAANSTTGLYTLLRKLTATYPVAGTSVNWTGGLGQSAGAPVDVSNIGYVISSFDYSPISDSFTISGENAFNSSVISTFSALVNGTTYNTTNGTIVLPYIVNQSFNATITATNHFPLVLEVEGNTSNTASVYPYTAVRVNSLSGQAASSFAANYTDNNNVSNTGTVLSANKVAWIPVFNSTFEVTVYNVTNGTADFSSASANLTGSPYLQTYTFTVYLSNTLVITFFDEHTGALLSSTNVTAYFTGTVISYNFTTTTGVINQSLLVPQGYLINYGAPGYTSRTRYVTLNNQSTQVLSFYLLPNSTGTYIRFTLLDQSYNVLPGAVINAQKKNLSGTNYYNVEDCGTDGNGECLLFLETLTTTYRFVTEYGDITRTTADTVLSRDTYTIVINTETSTLQSVLDRNSIQSGLSYEGNGTFSYTVNDPTNGLASGKLDIFRRYGGVSTLIASSSGSGTTFTIQITGVNTTLGDEVIAKGYVYINGDAILTHTISVVESQQGNSLAASSLLLFIGVTFTVIFMFSWNPIAPLMMFGVLFVVFSQIGLISIGVPAVTAIIIVIAVAIYRMRSV